MKRASKRPRSEGFWRDLARHRGGLFGLVIVTLFIVLAVTGRWIAPYDPDLGVITESLAEPSAVHLFGTDELGRDILSRVIEGSRIAILVAFISVGLALVIGMVAGVISGYVGGLLDTVLTGVLDILFAFPMLLAAIIIVAVLGPGLLNAALAIAIVYIPRFARIARASTLTLRSSEFLESARLAGVRSGTILVRHIFPNVLPSVIVLAALSMSTAQLSYASLSFLGLGISPPQADWGNMLSKARDFVTIAPWLIIWPTIALVLLMLAFNVLGDAVRDVLDPRHESGTPPVTSV
jgi:ABC-type dipeptide/oligopeptide/nickel transport system permease subunit